MSISLYLEQDQNSALEFFMKSLLDAMLKILGVILNKKKLDWFTTEVLKFRQGTVYHHSS